MTVTSSTNSAEYAGNGETTTFTVPFRFLDNSHLRVVLVDADGTEHTQVLNTDYTASGAGNATGDVTFGTAPATGQTIQIFRNVPITQEKDYVTGDKFPAESHEQALDKLTMIAQQQDEKIGRAWLSPVGETGGFIEAGAEGTVPKFDADGNLIEGPSADEIESAQGYAEDAAQSATEAAASADSAALSSASAGAASGRLDVASFAELATKFVYSAPGAGQEQVAAGDVILWREKGFAYKVAASVASDAHLDYTGSGGVKLYVLAPFNIVAFGALPAPADSSDAIGMAALAASGSEIAVPEGTFRAASVTGTVINLVGKGEGVSVLELATAEMDKMFTADQVLLRNLTVSDRGRASLDHTTGAAAALFQTTNAFVAEQCHFNSDRSVIYMEGDGNDAYCRVENVQLRRVNEPIENEEDGMNIFAVVDGTRSVVFRSLDVEGVVCRSLVNATKIQTTSGNNEIAVAVVEDCSFEHVYSSDSSPEVKVVFVNGFQSRVVNNSFLDCFGRHIDILGNLSSESAQDVHSPNVVEGNKVAYTVARQGSTGSDNDEPGSIYVRYGDVAVRGNYLDFTNLELTSNIYSGIAVRHGYKSAVIDGNVVIDAKAEAIRADISDSVDTDNCSVSITNNVVNSENAIRYCIAVWNNSSIGKIFENVVITDNTINYNASSTFQIGLDVDPARPYSFAFKNATIRGNFNPLLQSRDVVTFNAFPQFLDAPNSLVDVEINPSADNSGGMLSSLGSALSLISNYKCRELNISLATSVTSTLTVTGPSNYTPLPERVTIDGNNGASGRIRFYTAGTQQSNLSFDMRGSEIILDGVILNSDSTTSTTSLVLLTGEGRARFLNCEARYGEYFVDTRGPDVSIKGGTVNDINLGSSTANGIVHCFADIIPRISIEDVTGANNNRIYFFSSPGILLYENISVGTTTGSKSWTMVT